MQPVTPKTGRVSFVRATRAWDAGIDETLFVADGGGDLRSGTVGRQIAELLGLNAAGNAPLDRAQAAPASTDTVLIPEHLPNSPPAANFLTAEGFTLTGSQFRADTPTFPANISTPSDPVIEPLGSAGFVVVYAGNSGDVFRRTYDAAGAPTSDAVRVNNTVSGTQSRPEVAALSGGGYVVVWESPDASSRGVYARRYDAAGPLGNEFLVNTTTSANENHPVVAGLANGGFVVIWETVGSLARFQLYDSTGNPVGSETLLFDAYTMTGIDVAPLSNGGFVVSWLSPTNEKVFARTVGADGTLGPFLEVVLDDALNNYTAVEALSGGGFVVVWESGIGPLDSDISARVYDASFAPVGAPFLVNQTLNGGQVKPSLTAMPDGSFLVSWQAADVFVRKFAADGTPLTGEVALVTVPDGLRTPDLATVGDDTFVLWQQSSGGVGGVFGQRFVPTFSGYGATEQTATDLKGSMGISDSDAGSSTMTVTLSVGYGVIVVNAGTSGAVVTNSGTATVTIQGTIDQINALLATDSTSALSYVPNTDTPPAGTTLTFTVNDGIDTATATANISIFAVEDFPTAGPDSAAVNENSTVTFGVLANDTDPDGGTLQIIEVNGTPLATGQFLQLPSGAGLTRETSTTFTYDPAGSFNYLGGNQTATDSFTYTLNGGSVAVVTVTIQGVGSIVGDSGDNVRTGTPQADYFDLSQGGNDTANGDAGDDAFYFGAAFTGGDTVDGGAGSNDQIGLDGNYTGGNALVLGPGTIANIEAIVVLPGFSYVITTNDSNVPAGGLLKVQATQLAAGQSLTFDGSAETDGSFIVYGGQGNDSFTGGQGNDGFYFGPGGFSSGDTINGGGGTNDQIGLDGNYGSVGTPFVLGGNITNVEAIVLLPGPSGLPNSFNLSTVDSLVPTGQTMSIFGLQTTTGVTFDGSNEHDGAFRLYGGSGHDIFTGGDGNDWLFGSAGQDTLNGGAGADTYFYQAVSESTGPTYDRIDGFVSGTDKIDLPGAVAAVDSTVVGGALNSASFNSNLAAAIQASQLQAGDAVLFKPDAGTLAGTTFLIVDANGVAGYQADSDYVFQLTNPPAILQTSDFI